MQPMEVAR